MPSMKFELGQPVVEPFVGRIVARAEYEDGTVLFFVRGLHETEGEQPREEWIAEGDIVVPEKETPPLPEAKPREPPVPTEAMRDRSRLLP